MGPGVVLDHVQVAAPPGCEEQARSFYGTLIGLEELDKPPSLQARGGVWFSLSGAQLHIGVEAPFTPTRKAHPALRCALNELDEIARRLIAAGASVRWDDNLVGVSRFYTDDPWGNRLELLALKRAPDSGDEIADARK